MRSAYQPHPSAWRTSTGLPRSTRARHDRGGCPLYPEDGGAHPTGNESPAGTRRFPAASPCTPPVTSHPMGLPLTRHHRGFTGVHPSGLPLRLWPLDGTAALGLDRLSFAPRRYQRRTSGWGQASSTDLSYTFDIVDLQSVQLLNSCDFVSHLTTGTMAWLRSPRISADPTCWRPSRRRSLTGGQTDRVKTTT